MYVYQILLPPYFRVDFLFHFKSQQILPIDKEFKLIESVNEIVLFQEIQRFFLCRQGLFKWNYSSSRIYLTGWKNLEIDNIY